MNYLSVFSGIEAASVAWEPLGWKAVGFSEIEPFPCAVLKHHFPTTPNYGDITKHKDWQIENGTVNLLIGGSPCQAFSVAGLRKGLADPRGNLALVFLGLADKIRPRWIVWENVPGVLSSNGGRDFGSFLGALEQLGYGWAYRILDAQYFGVPQRRRRVFVVASLGGRDVAASVLLNPESLCWDSSPRGKKKKETSKESGAGVETYCKPFTPSSFGGYSEGVGTVRASGGDLGGGSETLIAQSSKEGLEQYPNSEVSGTIRANPGSGWRSDGTPVEPVVISKMSVRKLTPVETERLQGFPDNWSQIPWKGKPADQCPDGPRYKACGNSMAVPVMRWIGEQIARVESQAK